MKEGKELDLCEEIQYGTLYIRDTTFNSPHFGNSLDSTHSSQYCTVYPFLYWILE